MIKKFDEFNIESVKKTEQEHYDRELNNRKKMREERNNFSDLSFEDIKDFIIKEIEDGEDYKITTGKKIVDFKETKIEEIHINYQSPQVGSVKIYKPKDESEEGYYDINGKVLSTNADDVRNFYSFLNKYIKIK